MKTTLEKALVGVRPGLKPLGHADFNAMLKQYALDSGLLADSIKMIRDTPCTCQQLSRQWKTLSWLIGFVYWISKDYDSNIWNLLNITPEEEVRILDGMDLLKLKLTSYNSATKNTATRMLYDKITSQHF